jgi:eukaryotic-like serine/threonine-protein kinase
MSDSSPARGEAGSEPHGQDLTGLSIGAAPTQFDPQLHASSTIGPYVLLQKIAEGGMGEVWLAEQKQPVRRRVALKLIKAGMDSREIVLRFQSERQALALMDHPAIAKVYDAGSTPQGTPYFAMEYVPGVAISTYCEEHKLTTRERLELMVHVCEGVQHAHQKAIIHRDLKPSNILVSEVDGRPAPKIIDFGVAKALSQRLVEQTMFTRIGSIVGTPEYMSPEQASSGGEDIDTRSDIYSLGVILYEILAGVPPLKLESGSYYDFVRKLRETDTPKPSTRARGLAAEAGRAGKPHVNLDLLAKELRGDLDSITLKCLEKDRNRRYGSPAELAADIRRYLDNLPVLATPPSTAYRLRKFAKRNRGLLAAVCGVVAAVILGSAVSIYLAIKAHQAERVAILQRDRADMSAATAKAVSDFLQNDLLSQAGADGQRGGAAPDPDVKVRTLVDRAAAGVSSKFAGKPMVEADLRSTLGQTYLSLGLLPEAKTQLQQAYSLNVRTRGATSRTTLESLQALGAVEFNAGDYKGAAEHQKLAFESALKALGPQAPFTLMCKQSLAVDYMELGQTAQAEPLLKEVLAAQIQQLSYDHVDTLDTSDSLATLYLTSGRYAEAQQLLERGLLSYQKLFGPEHPNTQREVFGLARVSFGAGNYARAEELASTVYRSNLRLLGASHFKTTAAARFLGRILAAEGKLKEAESLVSKLPKAGDGRGDVATGELLAAIYQKQGEYAKAQALLTEGVQTAERVIGPGHSDTFIAEQMLGDNLLRQKRCEEAAPYLRKANEGWHGYSDPDWHRFEAQSLLGEALACQKQFAEAEPLLLSGYQGLKDSAPRIPAYEQGQTKSAAARLAALYTGWNKPEEASRWQKTALQ